MTWHKSSYSAANGDCVEVADRPGTHSIRDTKDHGHGPHLTFTTHEWTAFVTAVKTGEFD